MSRPPLMILGHPHQADGSGYYRFYLPYKHLARGVHHKILLPEPGNKYTPNDADVAELDVIAGQRMCGGSGVAWWERWSGKVKLVYETDDDILHPDSSTWLAHLHDDDMIASFKRCIALSDMVTVSTVPLAETLAPYNDNIKVLPNHVHADMLYLERPKRDRLTIGWAGGMSHLLDWMQACDPVAATLDDFPGVDMHFVGIDYAPLLRRRCRYTPWESLTWEYYKHIDFDIGLCPLADTQFNRCKSHIKALEYMALGIPVIASNRPAYNELVVDGVTGYLVNDEDEWRLRLRELINEPEMREEMGAKGREAVSASWTIQQGWKLWRDAYEEVAGWQA